MKEFDFSTYDYKRNLMIVGSPGVWKTYHAKKLYDNFPAENKLDKYYISDWRFKQLTQAQALKLRDPIDWQTGLEYYPLEIMIRCKLLVFDDIWVSDSTDAYIRNLTFVLDERIQRWLPIIFTSNLKNKELAEKLDARIASRVLENTDVIVMEWEDLRKQSSEVYSFKVKKEEK